MRGLYQMPRKLGHTACMNSGKRSSESGSIHHRSRRLCYLWFKNFTSGYILSRPLHCITLPHMWFDAVQAKSILQNFPFFGQHAISSPVWKASPYWFICLTHRSQSQITASANTVNMRLATGKGTLSLFQAMPFLVP